ncbi:MAG: hypothetical protein JSW23_00940 [Planctomycetota bacterium]|nr:MAG: hypothetical protein JSW23_00940 [Planctomycetota bacterium]
MNRAQKSAWFGLTMAGLLLIFFIPRFFFTPPLRLYLFWLSPNFGIVVVLLIFLLTFLLRKKGRDKVGIDERDSCISRRALIAAFSSTAGLFMVACIIGPFIAHPTTSMSVLLLPSLLYSLFIVFILVYSVAVLVQYGRGGKDGQG